MNAKLSTHVLDTASGRPAAGMKIELHDVKSQKVLKTVFTNSDGRTDQPLLTASEMHAGLYEIVFFVGDYFKNASFLDTVPVRFTMDDPGISYHVPLLCSPFAYSTYRGS